MVYCDIRFFDGVRISKSRGVDEAFCTARERGLVCNIVMKKRKRRVYGDHRKWLFGKSMGKGK